MCCEARSAAALLTVQVWILRRSDLNQLVRVPPDQSVFSERTDAELEPGFSCDTKQEATFSAPDWLWAQFSSIPPSIATGRGHTSQAWSWTQVFLEGPSPFQTFSIGSFKVDVK